MPYPTDLLYDTPADSAEVLRYMSLRKFEALLKSKALWFSDPADFKDDPSELRLPDSVADQVERSLEKVIELAGSDAATAFAERFKRELRARFRCNCWCLSSAEQRALWNEYAPGGVAVRSTIGRIKAALASSPFQVLIGRIEYVDFVQRPAHMDDAFWLWKPTFFSNEQEVRLVVEFPITIPSSVWDRARWQAPRTDDGSQMSRGDAHPRTADPKTTRYPEELRRLRELPGLEVPVDLRALMARVHVDPRSPAELRDTVAAMVRTYGLEVDVMRSDPYAGTR